MRTPVDDIVSVVAEPGNIHAHKAYVIGKLSALARFSHAAPEPLPRRAAGGR